MSAVASALASAVALPLQLVAPLAQQRNARQQNAQLQQNGKKPKLCDLPLSWTPSSGTVTPSIKQKKSIKHLFTNHKSPAISDELNYEDSEKRLIILFSIIALCFLICATSFLGCLHFL